MRIILISIIVLLSIQPPFLHAQKNYQDVAPVRKDYTPNSTWRDLQKWSQGEFATGSWFGLRDDLHTRGIDFTLTYINDIAGNPVGGQSPGFTYCDDLYFGLVLDFEKLVGWRGAEFIVSGLNRAGSSLSQKYIGNQFTVQQLFGSQTAMFYALIFEQKLFDDKAAIKIGRFAAGDDFATSPIYWLYMNNGIDGNPIALSMNTTFSYCPFASWAGRIAIHPTEETDIKFGIFQASDRIFNVDYHGLDWSIRSQDGVFFIGQFGWSPEFNKKQRTASIDEDMGEQNVETQGGSNFKMMGHKGNYWVGFYYSSWQSPQFGTTNLARNAYGFYWHADQMIYQEKLGLEEGLIAWSAFVFSPQQNIAQTPFQVNGGFVYKGLIPSRNNDDTILGICYGKFSRNFARTQQEENQGYPIYELVFEWGYRIQLTQFAYIQPDIQWVINPGGTNNIPNALVLGAQMGVTF